MAAALLTACAALGTMNEGGVPYGISNPAAGRAKYSLDFEHNVAGPVEYFDVYGEVRTRYSQVYWTRNTPIELPPKLVNRFAGKNMAITGYEIDQVTHRGPQKGTTTRGDVLGGFACYPSCEEGDKSVPSYHAYNHHYFAWLTGKDAELYEADHSAHAPNPTRTAFRDGPNAVGYPTSIVFKENPGGEYRKSYHGYPSGYAQLIHSPTQWVVEPMQIDTHNRNYGINDQEGFKPSFLPKIQQNKTVTQLVGGLSPLIECPCSDRVRNVQLATPNLRSAGACGSKEMITSEGACRDAVAALGTVVSTATVKNVSLPGGCVAVPAGRPGQLRAVLNTAPRAETAGCGSTSGTPGAVSGKVDSGLGSTLGVRVRGDTVTLTLTGPDNAWFGFGFAAGAMADKPYVILVDKDGGVSERRLGDHQPGTELPPSVSLVSSAARDGVRTVVVERGVAGATNAHWTFPQTAALVTMIAAIGNEGVPFGYHRKRTATQVILAPEEDPVCVCRQGAPRGFLQYMDGNTDAYNVNCQSAPRSDMAEHGDGSGRAVANMACGSGRTYHGGLHCCKHTWFLTDRDQDALVSQDVDVYFLKWRYYFQEYVPGVRDATGMVVAAPSHKHLHHWVFLIDADVNDYEEDNANYGTKSIGRITANVTGLTMGIEDQPKNWTYFTPLVMTPHFHAPNSIREELWNMDTGELLCNSTAHYGTSNAVFDEKDYIAIYPCLFGAQGGLRTPPRITAKTNIMAVKYFNNTFRHLGQMAQWTGLLAYDADPY